jgi:hypothetical protein
MSTLSTIFWLYVWICGMGALAVIYPQFKHPPLLYILAALYAVLFALKEGRGNLSRFLANFAITATTFSLYQYLTWYPHDLSISEVAFFAVSVFAISAMLVEWIRQSFSM